MISDRLLACFAACGLLFFAVPAAMADVYPVIVIGKVIMPAGSPPQFLVSIERECTDLSRGNGPQTDKKGQWIWQLSIDIYSPQSCVFRAFHDGYTSTEIDASNLNSSYLDKTVHVPDIMLTPRTADPYTIRTSGDNFPPKSKAPFERAIKDLDARHYDSAILDFKEAVTVAPKFADAWLALGIVYVRTDRLEPARNAFAKALEANPKLLAAYVTLTRTCLLLKEWQCASDNSDRLIKLDSKRVYPEIYLHQAAARLGLKNLAAAEQSANEMIRLDPQHKRPRVEWVLGRILEEKGDIDGAREHMKKYLSLEATAADAEQVQAHMLALGKPEAAQILPDLELPN